MASVLVTTLLVVPAWLLTGGPTGPESPPMSRADAAMVSARMGGDRSADRSPRPDWWHSRLAPRSRRHTVPGAVDAFVDQTVWFLISPAARARPRLALTRLGHPGQSPVDAVAAGSLERDGLGAIALARGGYRVLALSGPRARPRQVMLEFTAPARIDGRERWLVLGGVVGWGRERGWVTRSLQPRFPASGRRWTSSPMGRSDDLYAGLGWRRFTEAGEVRGVAR